MTQPRDHNSAGVGAESEHPLVELFADLARGVYPPADSRTETMPAPPGVAAAVLAFTAHCVVAADVDPAWVAGECADGDLGRAFSPGFLSALAARTGTQPGVHDLVLAAPGLREESDDEPLILIP